MTEIQLGKIDLSQSGVPFAASSWSMNDQCSRNMHVFGCDYAEKCKCGKSARSVNTHPAPIQPCAYCGIPHE